jgi:hypothetical protein
MKIIRAWFVVSVAGVVAIGCASSASRRRTLRRQ